MATTHTTSGSVEALERVLAYLVNERQSLQAHGAGAAELEANRRAIVAMQWQLSRALGAEHSPSATH